MSVTKVKRSDGSRAYQVRWRENGSNRKRTFDRKDDADTWDREVKRRKQLGPLALEQLSQRAPTLDEWVKDRWAPEHGVLLERRTVARYTSSYALHVLPWLGHVPLTDLTVASLREWQAALLSQGRSADAVTKSRTFLSSVLSHAAESGVIPGNPLGLVRAPKPGQADEVVPLPPSAVEAVRRFLAGPMPTRVPASEEGRRPRAAYDMPDRRDEWTRWRDITIVSVLAYAGPRPSELSALRWQDIGERTILVQRAVEEDGTIKATKGRQSRSVRLLAPVAADLREWRMACGNPDPGGLVIPRRDGTPWTEHDWSNWRSRQWRHAYERAGLHAPRPYDLRHSFASLLLAEGRTIHYVAKQLGHSPEMTSRTYGHVVEEFEDSPRIDAEREIAKARDSRSGTPVVPAEAI